MIIGVPKEIKAHEYRIALTPAGAEQLVADGHEVLIEASAGEGSGFEDSEYWEVGAKLVPNATDVYGSADTIYKVKEPLAAEYGLLRSDQTVFTYFHFAASRELTEACLQSGAICLAYETLEVDRRLPLLTPMSEVAGRMAVQQGARWLERPMGGRGTLLGGVPGVEPGHVVILGGGVVGTNAAKMAAGLGARVTILDVNLDRLRELEDTMPRNVTTIYSTPFNIRTFARRADLLIGAVLLLGARAPVLVDRELVSQMKNGSVIVDVAVDQGGCVETCRPTTHADPTYVVDGVLHYCVANMPGAVSRTSTFALTNATLPWARRIARLGTREALRSDATLRTALNVIDGKVTHPGVAEAFGMPCFEPASVL
jgi:alanine dehydrogenase